MGKLDLSSPAEKSIALVYRTAFAVENILVCLGSKRGNRSYGTLSDTEKYD